MLFRLNFISERRNVRQHSYTYGVVHAKRKNHDGASLACTNLLLMLKNSIMEHWKTLLSPLGEEKTNELKLVGEKIWGEEEENKVIKVQKRRTFSKSNT